MYIIKPCEMLCRLDAQTIVSADRRARASAGSRMPMMIAMMPMTTSNSTRVKTTSRRFDTAFGGIKHAFEILFLFLGFNTGAATGSLPNIAMTGLAMTGSATTVSASAGSDASVKRGIGLSSRQVLR